MAADAGLILERGQPIDLRDVIRDVALTAELILARDFQHREPVDRRIVFCRLGVVCRGHGSQVDVLAGDGVDFRRIDEAVAAHPNLVFGFRQVGQDVAALVVGHHDLGVTGGEIVGLRDHPDARFRTVRPRDHAADIVGFDANGALSVEPYR